MEFQLSAHAHNMHAVDSVTRVVPHARPGRYVRHFRGGQRMETEGGPSAVGKCRGRRIVETERHSSESHGRMAIEICAKAMLAFRSNQNLGCGLEIGIKCDAFIHDALRLFVIRRSGQRLDTLLKKVAESVHSPREWVPAEILIYLAESLDKPLIHLVLWARVSPMSVSPARPHFPVSAFLDSSLCSTPPSRTIRGVIPPLSRYAM